MADLRSHARFQQQTELLDFLLEVAEITHQTLDLDRLLVNVSNIVQRVIDCEFFAILLYGERSQKLRIRYSVGHRPELVQRLEIGLNEGITGTAAASREAILVGDVSSDPRYLKSSDVVRTEMAVPMMARGKLVGLLDVQSTRLNAYTEEDRSLLRLIASRVASAIENARLYRRLERTNRTLSMLASVSRETSSILDLSGLLKQIAASVRSLIQYDAFSVYLVDDEQQVLRHRFSVRYDKEVDLDSIPLGRGITGAAAASRETVRARDTLRDPRYIASHPSIRSEVAVPLIVRDRVIGVMDLECEKVGFFTDEHVRLLSTLAPQIAVSVENARLYEELASRERLMEGDLRSAAELQSLLLPRQAPEIRGLRLGVGLRPARQISGDIYDFFEHDDEHAVIAFGDVSGKGVAAALFGALVSGLLRTLAPRRRQPATLLKALNDALVLRKVEARYVVLLVALWHPHSGVLNVASAGALPPLIIRADGRVESRALEGFPLGLLGAREYEEAALHVDAGDTILLYSDGVIDHLNPSGEEYGMERLSALAATHRNLPADGVVARIFADLDRFGAGEPRYDDQTLLVLQVT